MRKKLIFVVILLLFSTAYLPYVYAQDWTRYDLPQGAKLRLGKGSVENITFSPDGKRLIVESTIGIWIYDAKTGVEIDLIAQDLNNLLGVSPDASFYVTSDENNTIQLRNLTDRSIKVTLKSEAADFHRIAFSPDRQTFAVTSDENIHLWNLVTGKHQATLTGHTKWIGTIVFSPDGTTLVSESSDNTIRLWDVETATHKTTLSKYASGIRFLMFSPDGNTLITGNTYDDIGVWDVKTGQKKSEIRTSSLTSMDLSPDGNTLASGGYDGLHLWDVTTGTHIAELGGHLNGIRSVAFSPDGQTLASGGYEELYLLDVETGERKLSIDGHTTWISGMAFSLDGNTLATTTSEKIHLWNPKTGEYKRMIFGGHWSSYYDLAFSPDGKTLATQQLSRVILWDVESATHIATLGRFGGSPRDRGQSFFGSTSIVFSPDGKFLFSGNNYSTAIHIWYGGRTQKSALVGHTEGINSITLNHDGSILASASNDHTVRLWDVATKTNISTFTGHTGRVFCVAFNPEGNTIASSSEDNTIMLWDVATGEPRVIHTGYINGVSMISFSSDGKTLASCGADYWDENTVRIWDVATGDLISTLIGHSSGVYNIAFSPDGKTLASASSDGTVMLWDYTSYLDNTQTPIRLAEDVNHDGIVDILDLIHVATQFGQFGEENAADVNGDGIVDIADILLVAAALENENGAPSKKIRSIEILTAAEIQTWLDQARLNYKRTPIYQLGIAKLEQLLTQVTPKETVLLPNYPNPFNPETWIPYRLSKPVEVIIHIYAYDGQLVRTLKLGHQNIGVYQDKTRAAYWDGKNEAGEQVASGIYFYSMTAGHWTATNRMVIKK